MAFEEAFDEVIRRPWSADELPDVARWLRRNERPLRLIVKATRRPRFYAPMIGASDDDESTVVYDQVPHYGADPE